MADFLQSYERMIVNEGGYRLTITKGDRGGMTFCGISRVNWPSWSGWAEIDAGRVPTVDAVRMFYRVNFWEPLKLSDVAHQRTASTLFDFAVNAGTKTAAKLAQLVVGSTPDGVIGPRTLEALNIADPDRFNLAFALAKIARYRDIVTKDRTQQKFLLGWINRTLKEAA